MRWLDVDGHEFKKAPGAGDEQGGLVCGSPRGCKESETTERPNNNKAIQQRQGAVLD